MTITLRYFGKAALLMLSDALLLCVAFVGALYLTQTRMEAVTWPDIEILGAFVLLQLLSFLKFGFYRAVLRYASIDFLFSVVKGVTIASLLLTAGLYLSGFKVPVQVIIVDWFLTTALVGGSRFVVRYYFDLRRRFQKGKRVLVYGAGDLGTLALRQLKFNGDVIYSPVGFVDDDLTKKGRMIHGMKVLGTHEEMEALIDGFHIEEVVVAIAEINGEKLREIVKRCRNKNVVCRIVPCFSRLVEVEPNMRNVELADLMRRSPRDLDTETIRRYLYGRRILVSGAAGSIGSELVRQILKHEPKRIIVFDQSELGLYKLCEELDDHSGTLSYVLGDITCPDAVENVFQNEKPEVVFHAAAYKHVPMLESNVSEAVRNNVGGTFFLAKMARKYNVESFVLISTDKAVKPSSVMGATKRVCELIVQNYNQAGDTKFMAVRFGNVLGSSGSVIPKFIRQIKSGGPVTVTHPDATRYFMLINEAVQLVLQSSAIGKGGEVFILNMGKPVRISEIAEDLIYLMGRHPHKDVKIEYGGMRAGEKIHEELFNEETEEKTRFNDITVGRATIIDLDFLDDRVEKLLNASAIGNCHAALGYLSALVPEGSFMDSNPIPDEISEPHAETSVILN